jgi:uncharacterized membrane protein
MTPVAPTDRRSLLRAGLVLGFALGGFLDGILLHQVLQWHHLLSLVPGNALRDLRVQVLADGGFHVLMYIIASLGLWMLWRSRAALTGTGTDLRLVASVLLGFGIWQFTDVILFHWLIGIHRIRVDVPNPLLWDLGWLAIFGVPAVLAAWWVDSRRDRDSGPPRGRNGSRVAAGLSVLVLSAAPLAAVAPAARGGATLVVFRPGLGAAASFAAVAAVDGRVLWADASGEVLAIEASPGTGAWPLVRRGAVMVGNIPLSAGCLAWIKV